MSDYYVTYKQRGGGTIGIHVIAKDEEEARHVAHGKIAEWADSSAHHSGSKIDPSFLVGPLTDPIISIVKIDEDNNE